MSWLMLPAIAAGLSGLLELATRFGESSPHLWSVPDRPRFLALTREERAPIVEQMRNFIGLTAVASTALLCVIQASIYLAATRTEPRMPGYVLGPVALHVAVLVTAGLRLNRRVSTQIRDAHQRRATA